MHLPMSLQNNIIQDDIKLDSVLSLILLAQCDQLNRAGTFHEKYGALFYGELERLEAILFEDGLIEYCVSEEGMEIRITQEGISFFDHGGYSGENTSLKVWKTGRMKVSRWNYLIVIILFLTLFASIILKNKMA